MTEFLAADWQQNVFLKNTQWWDCEITVPLLAWDTADFIRGERRMGEMLSNPDFPKNRGERGRFQTVPTGGSLLEPPVLPATYAELGLEYKRAMRDQTLNQREQGRASNGRGKGAFTPKE